MHAAFEAARVSSKLPGTHCLQEQHHAEVAELWSAVAAVERQLHKTVAAQEGCMEAVLGHAALLLQGRSKQGGHLRHAVCCDPWLHTVWSLLRCPHHAAGVLECLAPAPAWRNWAAGRLKHCGLTPVMAQPLRKPCITMHHLPGWLHQQEIAYVLC